jgi:muramoyltetrapeptide carboxypeptidase
MAAVLVPEALRRGDRVCVIAPSGPFDRTLVLRGIGWLATRYRVKFDRGIFSREGFLAGDDSRRLRELESALSDPDVRAVIAARGGYGLGRIAHLCDWRALRDAPRWLVGFSDVTAAHVEAARVGVASLHAHNAAGLGRGDAHARDAWVAALERPTTRRAFERLKTLHAGRAQGPLIGGNLTVLHACLASGRLSLPKGCVLLLEDVGETSYRLDRMLTGLIQSGSLDSVAGVVVGMLSDCSAGKWAVPAEDVVRERLATLRVPVATELPVGHGRRNDPIVLGAPALLDASRGELVVWP